MQQPMVLGSHRCAPPVEASLTCPDYGSLTLLFSQTVSGLQVQMPDGRFRDIKPLAGSIVVNVADTLSFMTNGYLKSTVHRVHRPPVDQAHIHRIGVIYGCRPNDNVPGGSERNSGPADLSQLSLRHPPCSRD